MVKKRFILYFLKKVSKNLMNARRVKIHVIQIKEIQIEMRSTENSVRTGLKIMKKEMRLGGKIYRGVVTRILNIA